VSASHRFHLRLPWALDSDIRTFARQHGVGLGPAIRLLVGRGLQTEAQGLAAAQDSPAALAALVASEHAVLMVASVLPEGERHMRSLGERAVHAAEERLALFHPLATDSEEQRA
jgi:hypothetical protein